MHSGNPRSSGAHRHRQHPRANQVAANIRGSQPIGWFERTTSSQSAAAAAHDRLQPPEPVLGDGKSPGETPKRVRQPQRDDAGSADVPWQPAAW